MSTPVKLVGFLVAIMTIFGIAFGVGRAVGPVGGGVGPIHHAAGSVAPDGVATSAGERPGEHA